MPQVPLQFELVDSLTNRTSINVPQVFNGVEIRTAGWNSGVSLTVC